MYVPLGVTVIVICVLEIAVHVHPSTAVELKLAKTSVGMPANPWLNVVVVLFEMVAFPLLSVL